MRQLYHCHHDHPQSSCLRVFDHSNDMRKQPDSAGFADAQLSGQHGLLHGLRVYADSAQDRNGQARRLVQRRTDVRSSISANVAPRPANASLGRVLAASAYLPTPLSFSPATRDETFLSCLWMLIMQSKFIFLTVSNIKILASYSCGNHLPFHLDLYPDILELVFYCWDEQWDAVCILNSAVRFFRRDRLL